MNRTKIKPSAGRGTINLHGSAYRAELMIDGRRARQTFPTVEEADAWLSRLVRLSRHGVSLDKTTTTVRQLFDAFYEAKQLANRKQATLAGYKVAGRHIDEAIGAVTALQLTAEHVQRLLARLHGKGFAPKHVYGIWAVLVGVLDYGVDVVEILDRNVARRVKPPTVRRSEHKILPEHEIETFLGAVTDPRDLAIFYVELSTGMRRGELIALRWEDYDRTSGKITVRRRIIRHRFEKRAYDYDVPKTRSGFRVVQLPAEAVAVLDAWRTQQELERRAFRNWKEGGWIFTSRRHDQRGEHLDPSSINWMLNTYLSAARLSHVNVHGLRHSFCTWLLSKGTSVKDVQQVVGHARPSITMDMYWQAIPGSEERVRDAVSGVLPVTPKSAVGDQDYPKITPKKGLRRVV